MWIYGERVKMVTEHPAFRDCALMLARLYDALHNHHAAGCGVLSTSTEWGGFTHRYFKPAADAAEQARDAILMASPSMPRFVAQETSVEQLRGYGLRRQVSRDVNEVHADEASQARFVESVGCDSAGGALSEGGREAAQLTR